MIHLDANILVALPYLIEQNHPLIERVLNGERAAVCAPVWYEFLIVPLSESERELARDFIRNDIVSVTDEDGALAAELFNRAGRKPSLKTHTLIAATAVHAKAEFLTFNVADFKPFVPDGLRLFQAP